MRRGFTFVEMMVVIFVMAALSVIATPHVVAMLKTTRVKAYFDSVKQLPLEAVNEARRTGAPVELLADESGEFHLEQTAEGQSEPTILKAVDPVPDITVDRFETKAGETGSAEWVMTFFPDGSSTRGGVQFDDGGQAWSLVIDDRGRGTLSRTELPEIADERWPAGDYVHRG